jgi:uncharacterized 2Fe-2S/4Fe-4S cluster protein (DUF4445 family)
MIKKGNGWIQTISLTAPSLKNNTADADRLIEALKNRLQTHAVDIDLGLLRKLAPLIRQWNYNVRCILFRDRHQWLLTGIKDARDKRPIAGLAVDLGTSRVVLRGLDLASGQILHESSFDNPQISVGPDILARIHYADHQGGLAELNRLIIDGLNCKIAQFCSTCDIETDEIYALAVAGNTAMTHLFMGLDPRWIIREPYIPVVNRPGLLKAPELGIRANPLARVLVFPNIGSYFGGDLIAGILYSGVNRSEDTAILVDVGTNAEVILGNKNWMIACAGAAGPALEGGVTKMGMMAGPGAIDRVSIVPETLELNIHTIDNQPPVGICGSGLIDLAAHLYLAGMIDIRGKFVPSTAANRLKVKEGLRYFVVVPAQESAAGAALTISQSDLDSLIRSKAAMYTILETITSSVGISLQDLLTFYIAGTFGSFIQPRSAISIGMLPDLPLERYKSLGNSSIGGAALALKSNDCLAEIDTIRDRITYLELNVNQEFMNRFSAAKFLPHTDPSRFPTVRVWRSQ